MKNYARILNLFYCQPWNIIPAVHASWGKILHDRINSGVLVEPPKMEMPGEDDDIVGPVTYDEDGNPEPFIEQMQKGNGVAIIPVHGVLGRHLSFLDLFCGGCDYEYVMQMIALAGADPAVHTIIFDFNSPGGCSIGNNECAEAIASCEKKTVAYFDEVCGSAAYLLASQCDEIFAAQSAITGSIGSYMALLDSSREWELQGLKLELFRSGPLKAIGLDGKTVTDEERAYVQSQVDYAAGKFKAAVLAKRPGISADAMQGQTFFASQCIDNGLVDGLANHLLDVVNAAVALGAVA